MIFRTVGLADNILDIASKINGKKSNYSPGDGKKFFNRRYPEYFCVIDQDNMIDIVLDEWVSTIYEYRVVYILDSDKSDRLFSVLKENVHSRENFSEYYAIYRRIY